MTDRWFLMSTEHGMKANTMFLVFLNERTGDVRKIEQIGTYPYIYTVMTEEEMLHDPVLREKKFVLKKKGEDPQWNPKKILYTKRVTINHPINHRKVSVTKVYGQDTWSLSNPRPTTRDGGTGLADFLPPSLTYNVKDKFADYFLRELGYIMGMPYDLSNGIQIIKEPHSDEIRDVVEQLKVPDYLQNSLNNQLLDMFFTGFGDFSKTILAFDIEIDNDYRQAIDPVDSKYPISSIGLSGHEVSVAFVLKDKVREKHTDGQECLFKQALSKYQKIVLCDTEVEILDKSLDMMVNGHWKIIASFHGDGFDLPTMHSRAMSLGMYKYSKEFWARYDPFKKTIIKGLKGKFLLDLYKFFSNPSIKIYAFKNKYNKDSLDEISEALLGTGKYKFEGKINSLCAQELGYYNIIDAERTYQLCLFDDGIVMNLIIMFMRISGQTFDSIHRRKISAVVKGLYDGVLYHSNFYQPNYSQLYSVGVIESKAIIEGKSYQGAYVFDPVEELNTVGLWLDEIMCLDFASLYPSEIKERNLCFSTINCEHRGCEDNIMPTLPHYVCKLRQGITSTTIGFIRDIRVLYFKKYKDKNVVYKIMEQVLKVLINASYGVSGFEGFQYYTAPLAEGTTDWGRFDILRVKDFCIKNEVQILYGDTDSIFVHKPSDEFLKRLFAWSDKELNLSLGIDYKGNFMLIYKKKNYIIDNEGKTVIKGMTGKKSNTPVYIRNVFTKVIMILEEHYAHPRLNEKIEKVVDDAVRGLQSFNFNPEELIISMRVNQPLHAYKSEGRHVKAAKRLANYLRKQIGDKSIPDSLIIQEGMTIDFVMENNNVAMPIEMIKNNENVDVFKYQELLLKSMSQLLLPLGIDINKLNKDHAQSSLEEFF